MAFALFSCDEGQPAGGFIPSVPVNVTVNLSTQAYIDLQPGGLGYAYVPDEGVRGLVIYRVGNSSFRCFDRACSYDYLESCGLVSAQASGFALECSCPSSSVFSWEGLPVGGPAALALRQYTTALDGNLLFIVN